MPKFSDPPLMWMERAATSRFGYMVLAAPRALVSIRIVCAVRGANTQVFLGWSGTASTSTVTPSVTAGKSACGWHDARSQSRHTRDSWTTWWVSPVTDTLKTVTVSHTHTAAIFLCCHATCPGCQITETKGIWEMVIISPLSEWSSTENTLDDDPVEGYQAHIYVICL